MKTPHAALALVLLAGFLLSLAGTALVAVKSPAVHTALMQRIAASGLAAEQQGEFRPGLLRAHSAGRIGLHDSLCGQCAPLHYEGTVHHGLGAWLAGDFAPASAEYALRWSANDDASPALRLRADLNWQGALAADLSMPAWTWTAADFRFRQDGLEGQLVPGQLRLQSPGWLLLRADSPWLRIEQPRLEAAAADDVQALLRAVHVEVAAWQWRGQDLELSYRQDELARRLGFEASLAVAAGGYAGRAGHGPVAAELNIARLDLESTQAFARELPGLLAQGTSRAMRMLGLMSLYSLHGPAFFSSAPQLQLHIPAMPLPDGEARIAIDLRVREGVRRPPMHPLEWQQALSGSVELVAPREVLQGWWQNIAGVATLVTGLPRDYRRLIQGGWVRARDDGRDRLVMVLGDERQAEPVAAESPVAALP